MTLIGREWHVYLLAHFSKSLLWHSSGLAFAFFLTETCGLTGRAMGVVLGGSLFVNALADGLVGAATGGRARSRAAAGDAQGRWGPVAGLCFALFTLTALVPPFARLGIALTTLVAFRLAYAAFDVPQNALVPLVAGTAEGRARLLAARNMLSGAASVGVAVIAAPILIHAGPSAAMLHAIWGFAIAGATGGSAWWLAVTETRGAPDVPSHPADPTVPMAGFVPLLAITSTLVFASTLFRSMESYAAAFAGSGIGLMLAAATGAIVSQPLWVAVERRLAARWPPLLAGLVVLGSAALTIGPARATSPGVMLTGLGFGIGSGGLWLMMWARAMDRAATGGGASTIGLFTAASKLAQGLAAIWLGETLDRSAYRVTLADPVSLPSLTMTGSLVVVAGCGLMLVWMRPVSRKSRGEGSAMRRPVVPSVPDRAARPSRSLRVPFPHAGREG